MKRYNRHGEFMHPADDGEWVPFEDTALLRQQLSLAQDGLASYEQENQRLKSALQEIASLATPENAEDDERQFARMREIARGVTSPAEPSAPARLQMVANHWIPLEQVLEAIRGDWMWIRNSRCKYVDIRVDTRSMHCVIYDRDRVRITLDELRYQYSSAPQPGEPQPVAAEFDTPK